MTRNDTNYVIGAFNDRSREDQAIKDLRKAGFEGDSVEVADHSKNDAADVTVAQALKDRGFTDEEARFYQNEFRGGADLVTVKADGRRAEAEAILARYGRRAFAAQTTTAPGAMPVGRATGPAAVGIAAGAVPPVAPHAGARTVQLKEEELQAHKEKVHVGDVVVKKEVHTEHKTIQVPVTREEAVIERRAVPGNEPATGPMKNEEIRIPIMEERVEVEKKPVVKEEIVVGKRAVQGTQKVSGTVREEEAKIERHGDVARTADIDRTKP